jgi:hypothetical protein
MKTKKFDAGGLTDGGTSGGAKGALDQVGQSLDQISNALNGGQKSSFGFAPNASPGLPGPNTSPGLPTATEAMNKLSPGSTFKKGGKVASASKRGDGIAQRGKTRGKYM